MSTEGDSTPSGRGPSLLGSVHASHVLRRRVQILARRLAGYIPLHSTVLDVGCGDGLLAQRIGRQRSDLSICGVDVLVRRDASLHVEYFDGVNIPYPNKSVDIILLIDVLHHAKDPEALLADAARVARRLVIIKDHLREGVLANTTLRFMDWVGNARYGVRLPYTYWSKYEWESRFQRLQLNVSSFLTDLSLYPWPAGLLFDRSLHFIATLTPAPVRALSPAAPQPSGIGEDGDR